MKSWRALGLVWAVLSLGSLAACGEDGGGGDKSDGGDDGGDYGGRESGIEPDEDTGVDPEDGGGEDVDAEVDAGELDTGVDSGGGEVDSCVAKSCSELGYNCGIAKDGCGGDLNCGPEKCSGTVNTCGGGGKPNICGCTPKTCEQLSSELGVKVCGMLPDGCGGMLTCGGNEVCGTNQTCGGGGIATQCGCTPNLAGCAGKECGTAVDGCGNTIQCGASAGTCSANKECNAEQKCTCKADTTAFCTGKCGEQQTPDGCTVQCTACNNTCTNTNPGAACTDCACTKGDPGSTADDQVCTNGTCCLPDSVLTTCGTATCGTKTNNCGQAVSCGTCGDGLVCSGQALCETPKVAALIGKYAMRSSGFGASKGSLQIVSRAEGLLLVDIERNAQGKLMMREQSCWAGGYVPGVFTPESTLTTIGPELAGKQPPTLIELDVSETANVPGPKQWLRGTQPLDQNAVGWRRNRPSFCPEDGSPANESHPDFAPAGGDPRAVGGKKPWLGTATCLCPAQEVAKRGLCAGLTGAARATCIDEWAKNTVPFQPSSPGRSSDVTDCRVNDDDQDRFPGVTVKITYVGSTAVLRSTSSVANNIWGAVDLSAEKHHWGVSQDLPGLRNSSVACENERGDAVATGLASAACAQSEGRLCPAYKPNTQNTRADRINPLELVWLGNKPTPAGGWTCGEVVARRGELFGVPPNWASMYPDIGICPE